MTEAEIKKAANEILFYLERRDLAEKGVAVKGDIVMPPILKAVRPPEPKPWDNSDSATLPSGISKEDAKKIWDIVGSYYNMEEGL